MSLLPTLSLLLALLLLSAAYSGSETGVYSLSRVRMEAEAREGRRAARLLRRLLVDDTALLITLLIGNNVALELTTHLARESLAQREGFPQWGLELAIALVVTPVVFLFGELLPKDLFRRRPHVFLGWSLPLLAVSRVLFLPLSLPLRALARLLERAFGIRDDDFARALGREEMREILREGTLTGALQRHAEELANNVLVLRETPVADVCVPWSKASTVDLRAAPEEFRRRLEESEWARLPVLDVPGRNSAGGATAVKGRKGPRRRKPASSRVVGYVHQFDVLTHESEAPLDSLVRPIASFPPDLPVDRALARLRLSGQRIALVGPPEAPSGLITLMDLVACISGAPPA